MWYADDELPADTDDLHTSDAGQLDPRSAALNPLPKGTPQRECTAVRKHLCKQCSALLRFERLHRYDWHLMQQAVCASQNELANCCASV